MAQPYAFKLLTVGDVGVATFGSDNYQVKWTATTPDEHVFKSMRDFYTSVRDAFCLTDKANRALFDSATNVMVLDKYGRELRLQPEDFLDEHRFKAFLEESGARHVAVTNYHVHLHYVTGDGQPAVPTSFNLVIAARGDIGKQIAILISSTNERVTFEQFPRVARDLEDVIRNYSTGNFIPSQTPQQQD